MENGSKAENGKKLAVNRNCPRPDIGKKWPKNGERNGIWVHFLFCTIFLPFFPYIEPRAISFLRPIFSRFRLAARFPFYISRTDSQRSESSYTPREATLLQNKVTWTTSGPHPSTPTLKVEFLPPKRAALRDQEEGVLRSGQEKGCAQKG